MDIPDKAVDMISNYIEIHGDPFEPWESVGSATEKEIRCHGCRAIGESRYPDWQVKIDHGPDCAWVAFRNALGMVV